jgi:hypothetical protein
MSILNHLASALQELFTSSASRLARSSGFVQRSSKLGGALFAQTLVFTYLANPDATLDELSQTARFLGLTFSPQAIAERCNQSAASFLHDLLALAVRRLIAADPLTIPLLEPFSAVFIEDSTTIVLPDALQSIWAGCGSSTGQPASALKVNLRLNLTTGQLESLTLHAGRVHDRTAAAPLSSLPPGSVYLADLGYFSLARLQTMEAQGDFFLSRLQVQTTVFDAQGQRWDDLVGLLERQGAVVDMPVRLGVKHQLEARLLAVRVPQEVADQRRRRLRAEARRRHQAVSARSLALADWTLLITNAPVEKLSVEGALVLARVRWQIELLFKLWKSQGKVDESRSGKEWRVLCDVYAKLLAMVVMHWVWLASLWGYVDKSLVKAVKVVQKVALMLGRELWQPERLMETLEDVAYCLEKNCHLNRRKKHPNTYQLLLAVGTP